MKANFKTVLPTCLISIFAVVPLQAETAVDFGPVPGAILSEKTSCRTPQDLARCKLPSVEDVQKEIDVFTQNMSRRDAVIKDRLAYLKKTAAEVRSHAGDNKNLKSYKFYQDAADKLESLEKTDKTILEAKILFDPKQSPVIEEFKELKKLMASFQSKIDKDDSKEVVEAMEAARNAAVLKKLDEIRAKRHYPHIQWRFFESQEGIVTAILSNQDNRSFSLIPYVHMKSMCAHENIALSHIAVSSEVQRKNGHDTNKNFLSLIGDGPVVKKILDSDKPLTFQCEESSHIPSPGIYYDQHENKVTTLYRKTRHLFHENMSIPATYNLTGFLREQLSGTVPKQAAPAAPARTSQQMEGTY